MKIRPATPDDAGILFAWRNDPATRAASHNTDEVALAGHLAWLESSLRMDGRKLYIAEVGGVAVGTVRVDYGEHDAELSWTVAPEARGNGHAKRMVSMVADELSGPIRAEVKVGNAASVKVAQAAGMALLREEAGVLHFLRP